MGIRPFVAIRQDLSSSAPNIQESQMKGLLVGPCIQSVEDFSEELNVSTTYGSIASILTDAAAESKVIAAAGITPGAKLDFSSISFGAKTIKAEVDFGGEVLGGHVKSAEELYIVEIDITGTITLANLLDKGLAAGDTLDVIVDNTGTPETETHTIRSVEIFDDAGTDRVYVYLWNDIANVLVVDESIIFTMVDYKNISEAFLDILAPLDVDQSGVSNTAYYIDNQSNPVDGGFSVTLYIYKPTDAAEGVTFSNRQILTSELNTLSNYEKITTVYRVIDGTLYNFFEASRADLANNIFEVTTETYVSMLGAPTISNKLSYAMSLIAAEVPGATMKVYVTEDDSSAAYISALGALATASDVYSITTLTDSEAVINSTVAMVKSAAEETVAKWKMAVNAPRVPFLNKKIETDTYTVSTISGDEYYIDSTEGGFLSVGSAIGDYIFGDSDLDIADGEYYTQYGEPYTARGIAKIDSVITDNRIKVTVITTGLDLSTALSGQNLIVAVLDMHASLITNIKNRTESIDNHGVVSIFPDKAEVSINDEDILIPGYYVAAITNAVMAHLPPQQGLSNLSYSSIKRVIGSSFYFTDGELDEIASSGVYVLLQQNYSTRPYVLRQLTTDVSSLETMEINKVRCLDYATLAFAAVLDDFVGKRNVNTENITDIERLLNSTGNTMVGTTEHQYLGPVITEFEIVDVFIPDGEKDAISCIVDVETPTSLNKIRLFVSSGKK